jgi:hypothetical protein
MTRRPLVVLAVLAALAGGLTACSSGGNVSSNASPSAQSDAQQRLANGRRFAQCARDHGYPNFPDPEINGDRLEYPATDPNLKDELDDIAKVPECKALADQIRGRGGSPTPPSAADLAKLRELATCMRAHGIPEWPDPKADGTFPLTGTPLESEGRSERVMAGMDTCKHLYDGRIVTS